jgi:hypothetical protein
VLAGYVLVSGTLASADSIGSAQKDVAQEKDEQIHTAIQISANPIAWSNPLHLITFNVKNIGSAPIGDFNRTDVFILINEGNNAPWRYSFNGTANLPGINESRTWGYTTISPDGTHPYMLDPGENMAVEIDCTVFGSGPHPTYVVNVTTPNGITNGSLSS